MVPKSSDTEIPAGRYQRSVRGPAGSVLLFEELCDDLGLEFVVLFVAEPPVLMKMCESFQAIYWIGGLRVKRSRPRVSP